MIPAALAGLLAVSRLGAIHAVVFGGFASNALAQRIDASRPKAILTASCGIDGNKPPIPYRDYIVEAERLASWKTPRTIVWQREQLAWHPLDRSRGELNWNRLVRSAKLRNQRVKECVPVKGTDAVYVIYTSGTTGLPKGVVRDAAGHAVGLSLSMRQMFGIQGPGDVVSISESRFLRGLRLTVSGTDGHLVRHRLGRFSLIYAVRSSARRGGNNFVRREAGRHA